MRTSDEIREGFLHYFEGKAHLRMPSASLIPAGDPTLLLTSAGMVPFKAYFMGQASPPARRMTSSQKSFRTTDIDAVGDDTHCTFFEMLGNFSVGDYFKKEAIAWAWEFSTQVLQLAPERIWITIYLDDDEAFDHWRRDVGVPEERIIRFGEEDNYWGPAGNEGPCGPCSELHYDFHPERGMNGERPNDDSGRFVEFWNLVFMQFYQHLDGTRVPLPAPNIDTGMGLDRTAVILQGARNVYETDLFQPIVARVCELAKVEYGAGEETDTAIRVVSEHSRGAVFLIGDGVVPRQRRTGLRPSTPHPSRRPLRPEAGSHGGLSRPHRREGHRAHGAGLPGPRDWPRLHPPRPGPGGGAVPAGLRQRRSDPRGHGRLPGVPRRSARLRSI